MNKIVLFDIDYTLFDTDHFKKSDLKEHKIYEEIIGVLEEVSKVAQIGIFSEGELLFQKNKLTKTKIMNFFKANHVYISKKKEDILESVLAKYKNNKLFLIDDKLMVLYKAKILAPSIFTIWIKRGVYAINQRPIEDFVPDYVAEDLNKVVEIIKRS